MIKIFKVFYLTAVGTVALMREQARIHAELERVIPRFFHRAVRHGILKKVTVILLTKRNANSYPLAKLSCGHWVYTRSRTMARCGSCAAWKRMIKVITDMGVSVRQVTRNMVRFGKAWRSALTGKRRGKR